MQPAEKRKSLRRAIRYPAWINLGDGSPQRECSLCDASQQGAQLAVADPDSLPDRFTLALSADGAATRQCLVVWRAGNQIGVEFLKSPANKQRAVMTRTNIGAHPDSSADPIDIETLSKS